MSVQWNFEPDVTDQKGEVYAEDPMLTVFTFGMFIGQTYGNVMLTQRGRKYMQWLLLQKNDNEQWEEAHQKRKQRIEACFKVYQDYLEKSTSEVQ